MAWKVYCLSLKQWCIMLQAFILNQGNSYCSPHRGASFLKLHVGERSCFKKSTTCTYHTGFHGNNWSSPKKLQVWIRWYSTSSSLCLMGWSRYPSSSKIWGVAFPQLCTLIWQGTLQEHHSSEASPKTWGLFLLLLLEKEKEFLNNRDFILSFALNNMEEQGQKLFLWYQNRLWIFNGVLERKWNAIA